MTTTHDTVPGTIADSPTRSRLTSAMTECIADLGFRATTVADIVRVARMSRRSFYEHFPDKTACFTAVLRDANKQIIDAVAKAIDPNSPWSTQIEQAVRTYVEANEAHPGLTLSWIRELPALGETGQDLKVEGMDEWISLFTAISSTPQVAAEGIVPVSRPTGIMIWGGIRELTANSVETGTPLSDIIEPATQACIALIAQRRSRA